MNLLIKIKRNLMLCQSFFFLIEQALLTFIVLVSSID